MLQIYISHEIYIFKAVTETQRVRHFTLKARIHPHFSEFNATLDRHTDVAEL